MKHRVFSSFADRFSGRVEGVFHCVENRDLNRDSNQHGTNATISVKNYMAILCVMPTIQYSARSAWLSV